MSFTTRVGRVCAPQEIDFLTRELPAPSPGEVIIRIRASALCGSDLHIYKGKHPAVPLPATIGHEFAGDVAAVGPGVTQVAVGDRVTVEPCIVCGHCDACRHGDYGYCESISFLYRNGDGAMADYIKVQAGSVYKLPNHLSYEAGALIEPLAVATHAVRRADIRLGEQVLVLGAGAIGTLVAALCRISGAGEVIVVDYSDTRLKLAKEMGATQTVNPGKGEKLEDMVKALTGATGMDKTFECVGLEATFNQAIESLRRNGLATIVGIFENPMITVNAMRFINHEIRVQGAQGYCWDFPIALQMSKAIPLEKLVTHTFPLEELKTALETCFDKAAGSMKVLIKP